MSENTVTYELNRLEIGDRIFTMILAEMKLRMKRARESKGLGQQQAADVLGVGIERYRKWEQASSTVSPPLDYLVKFSQVFNVGLDQLIKGEVSQQSYYRGKPIHLSPHEADMVCKYRMVGKDTKDAIDGILLDAYLAEQLGKD